MPTLPAKDCSSSGVRAPQGSQQSVRNFVLPLSFLSPDFLPKTGKTNKGTVGKEVGLDVEGVRRPRRANLSIRSWRDMRQGKIRRKKSKEFFRGLNGFFARKNRVRPTPV